MLSLSSLLPALRVRAPVQAAPVLVRFAGQERRSGSVDPKFAQAKLDRLNRIEKAAEMFSSGILPGEITEKLDLGKSYAISTVRGYLINKAWEAPEFKEILSENMDRAFHEPGFLHGCSDFEEASSVLRRLEEKAKQDKALGRNTSGYFRLVRAEREDNMGIKVCYSNKKFRIQSIK
ncbi:hypothetical protein [Phaffia rhodozyma]|uniref:Uncharacterized protein n=1 Tax=Phaffia rhodozyma TaxID=264483 RepID=A0A0F7ST54_PHARH|nr:hypothetical protein [Phaffia rhodozyma]